MKRNLLSKMLPAIVIALTALVLSGCNVSVTSTRTETKTDANGNITTTTTVKENGKVTSRTTEEETTAPEVITASISFRNNAGFDITELYFAGSTVNDWGSELLGEDAPLRNDETIRFSSFRYSGEMLLWDLRLCDAEGTSIDFEGLDMSLAADPENITITLEYDAERDVYTAFVQ